VLLTLWTFVCRSLHDCRFLTGTFEILDGAFGIPVEIVVHLDVFDPCLLERFSDGLEAVFSAERDVVGLRVDDEVITTAPSCFPEYRLYEFVTVAVAAICGPDCQPLTASDARLRLAEANCPDSVVTVSSNRLAVRDREEVRRLLVAAITVDLGVDSLLVDEHGAADGERGGDVGVCSDTLDSHVSFSFG
jgi:hypothetical protein